MLSINELNKSTADFINRFENASSLAALRGELGTEPDVGLPRFFAEAHDLAAQGIRDGKTVGEIGKALNARFRTEAVRVGILPQPVQSRFMAGAMRLQHAILTELLVTGGTKNPEISST